MIGLFSLSSLGFLVLSLNINPPESVPYDKVCMDTFFSLAFLASIIALFSQSSPSVIIIIDLFRFIDVVPVWIELECQKDLLQYCKWFGDDITQYIRLEYM